MFPQNNIGFVGDEPMSVAGVIRKLTEDDCEKVNRSVLISQVNTGNIEHEAPEICYGRHKEADAENKRVTFEDALDMIGFGKSQLIILLVSGLTIMTILTETMGMSIIMAAAQCDLSLTDTRKGLISSISFLGILLAAQIWGYISDTRGRRKVCMYTMLLGNACTLISSFATNIWFFLVARFFVGFFYSASSAAIYAYLGEFISISKRAAVISYACIFAGLAYVYIPLLGWLILPHNWSIAISDNLIYRPWRLLLIANMLPGFVAALCLFKLPESGKYLLSQGHETDALIVLKWLYTVNSNRSSSDFPIRHLVPEINQTHINNMNATKGHFAIIKSFWCQLIPLYQKPLRFNFTICCFLTFGVFFVSGSMGLWYTDIQNRISTSDTLDPRTVCDILESVVNLEYPNASTHYEKVCVDELTTETFVDTAILGAGYVIAYIIYAIGVNAIGLIIFLRAYLFLSGFAGLALQWVTQPTALVLLFSAHIIFAGVCISVLTGTVVMLIPTQFRGTAVSLSLMFGRLGTIIGSNVVGVILKSNCTITFYLYSGFIMVCALISLLLPTMETKH